MNKATRMWRRIGPRIYGLALIMKVGIPLLFILSMAVGGYVAFSAISKQVADFQLDVKERIALIQDNAEALKEPIDDFNRQFEKVMDALKPVVNAVNKIGDIWPISELNLNFLRLPTIPSLGPVIDQAKALVGSSLAFQTPLLKMSSQVRQAYALAVKVASVVSVAFSLWVVALIVVFGARWYREFVHGWKLLLHGAVPAPIDARADFQAQIDALKAEVGSRRMSQPATGPKGSLWLVLLAFLLLFLYAWNSQNRLFDLLSNQPVAQPLPTDETRPPPPDPDEQTTLVELDGKLLFNAGSAVVSKHGRQAVQRLVPELLVKLTQEPDRVLVIGGHTDDVPIKHSHFMSNRALSFARASAVAQLLVDNGLPAQRVVAIGFGASRPRIPNDDAVSRHLNRRVELLLVPMTSLEHQVPDRELQTMNADKR